MSVLFSYLKCNYPFFIVFLVEGLLSFVLSLILKKKQKNLSFSDQISQFLVWLPSAILEANLEFPVHGDGSKRLDEVVKLSSRQFPLIPLSFIVECVDQILDCDKLIKEGGDDYASSKSSSEKRSPDIQTDGTSVWSGQLSQNSVSRRSTFLSK